ncbi:MAG: hypothetical protein JWN04_1142 [Myxococcaceae bacterium]|nr:hypothetical protein [Myxococcaceae bacterium]
MSLTHSLKYSHRAQFPQRRVARAAVCGFLSIAAALTFCGVCSAEPPLFEDARSASPEELAALAGQYATGQNVPLDAARAAQLFEQACEAGHARACSNLGVLYSQGTGVAANEAQAGSLFARSCEAGYAPACFNLGLTYERKPPASRARALFRKACSGGHDAACTKLQAATPVALAPDAPDPSTEAVHRRDRALTNGIALGVGAGNESAGLGGHALIYVQMPSERWRLAVHGGVGWYSGQARGAGGVMTSFGRRHRLVLSLLGAPSAYKDKAGGKTRVVYGAGALAGYEWMASSGFALRTTLGVLYRPTLQGHSLGLAINLLSVDYKFW